MMVKSRYHIFAILLMACMMVACGGHADRASLVAIDSLIMLNPDSACELLAAYPADSLTTDDDRAYHALLTTIADYKAYRPATTDSAINIAVDHYDHNGANPDHRMRSLLYKGCVMEELGDPEQAIEYYKRAETVCPTDDYFNIGYICYRKALLYQTVYADSIPIQYYRKAVSSFQYAGNKIYEAKGLIYMGLLYSQCDPDSAQQFIEKGILMAKQNNDSVAVNEAYNSLCTILYIKESYNKVTELVNQNYVPREGFCNRFTYDIISISFSKLGHPDSAETYLKLAPMPNSAEDSVSEMRAIAELALAKGDFRTYIKYNDLAVNNADSILIASQADKIREAEAKYDMAMIEVGHLSKQRRLILALSILVLLITATSVVVYLQRKRISLIKIENEEARTQLATLKRDLDSMASESQKRVDELKNLASRLSQMRNEVTCLKSEIQPQTVANIEPQLQQTIATLNSTEIEVAIQNKTRFCLDEILRLSFYSGKYNSDQVIDNDSLLVMSPKFWNSMFEIVSMKHDTLFERIAQNGITLTENEKKLIALCSINIPSAIIRRILNYTSIQVVTNQKRKLAKKITTFSTRIEDVFA